MNASPLGLRSIVAFSSVVALVACSATGSHEFTGVGGGNTGSGASGTVGTGAATSTGALTGATTTTTTSTGVSTSSTGSGMQVSSAYAHTATSLYQINPAMPTQAPVYIGDFDCLSGNNGQDYSMTDLAVNAEGALWGVSEHFVYPLTIVGSTVHCAGSYSLNVSSNAYFFGLTFAPAGVLGSGEVLVAANTAGELWAIEPNGTGVTLTQHGTFGAVPANDGHGHNMMFPGTNWELSGDIVFLANNGNPLGFATVRDCPKPPTDSGCNTIDTLIEIDVGMLPNATTQSVTKSIRGQVVKAAGCNDPNNANYGSMFGIAASGSSVFGFSHTAQAIVEINNNDGSACLVLGTPNQAWDGAAITTVAQVMPPTVN